MTRPISDDGTLPVLVHVLMNELGVIGAAAQTLEERGEVLPPDVRATLLVMINEAVDAGLEHLRTLLHVGR